MRNWDTLLCFRTTWCPCVTPILVEVNVRSIE